MLPETGLFMPVFGLVTGARQDPDGTGLPGGVDGALRSHHALKVEGVYAKLFLEGGREMAGVGVAASPLPS